MSVTNPQKTVSTPQIRCGGTATVNISFDACARLTSSPADIVLIMDRSGSMTQERLTFAKAAARDLITSVAAASGGTAAGPIANGSRMGIVSFADNATSDVPLSTAVPPLIAAIDALNRGGFTNHKAAFETAGRMLGPKGTNRQVIVIFTDGVTTVGGDAAATAESLKRDGIEIFCIGLVTDPFQLNIWASEPDSTHVAYTDDAAQLGRVFGEITDEVILAGVRDGSIRETLHKDFKIVKVHTPSDGTVQVTGQQTLTWLIDAAGSTAGNTPVSLSFEIMHVGATGGTLPVNEAITYEDRDGNTLTFPSPSLTVDCSGAVIHPEPCPVPVDFEIDGCTDSVRTEVPSVILSSLGRIVQVDVTLRNVCPGKRVAAAILLTERGPNGEEYARGTKTVTVPALPGDQCQDVILRCIHFVVPEDVDVTGDPHSLCNPRSFSVRVLANYLDTDFLCCDTNSVIL